MSLGKMAKMCDVARCRDVNGRARNLSVDFHTGILAMIRATGGASEL